LRRLRQRVVAQLRRLRRARGAVALPGDAELEALRHYLRQQAELARASLD
jgi:hypothetical protein